MKIGYAGNKKLGTNCVEVSRPVGDTCPRSCPYLAPPPKRGRKPKNPPKRPKCYAEKMEAVFPGVRPGHMVNLVTNAGKLRSALLYASMNNMGFRFHVAGDWVKGGFDVNGKFSPTVELDEAYLADVEWAAESIKSRGDVMPDVWFYTHVYDARIAALSRFGFAVYASVHSEADIVAAKAAGFTLFAYGSLFDDILPAAPQGGANHAKRSADWRASLPAVIELGGERFKVCPEQRKGDRVSCTGSPTSLGCKWCVNGRGNVAFARH